MASKGPNREEKQIREIANAVQRLSQEHGVEVDDELDPELPATLPDLQNLMRQVKKLAGELKQARHRLEQQELKVKAEMEAATAAAAEAASERETLEELAEGAAVETEALSAKAVELAEKEAALVVLARDLENQRIEAEAGFAAENSAALATLEAERRALIDELSRLRHQAVTDREAACAAVDASHEAVRQEKALALDRLREELTSREAELEAREQRVARAERIVGAREADIAEEQELLDVTVARRVSEQVALAEGEVAVERQRVAVLRQQLAESVSELEELRHSTSLDGRPAAEVLSELSELRRRCSELQADLLERPDVAALDRLAEVQRQNEAFAEQIFGYRRENAELNMRLSRNATAANEIEVARDRVSVLESMLAGYREELAAAREDWDSLTDAKSAATPFPSLAKIDVDPEAQNPDVRTRPVASLPRLVESLQQRMAVAMPGRTLYYETSEIRVFLAGLASSRLHLLQGISGTGKTSLPLAFARAVQGGCEVIEVQAGWRDRQDLLGFYNSFEKRFDERRMTQALYSASTPQYADRPFLIVLDEMNLSHPEQYFADFLSLLERGTDRIELMTASVENHPRRLIEGRYLPVADNVWFIGTANRDETTVAFADKTYDRAHVMELPESPRPFAVKQMPESAPVSLGGLNSLFAEARDEASNSFERVMRFLDDDMAPELGKVFNVGWSHRLRRIAESFVPVMVISDGQDQTRAEAEAADHLLATKVFRKLEGRFDVGADDFKQMEDHLLAKWHESFGDDTLPAKSVSILEREVHRLGG